MTQNQGEMARVLDVDSQLSELPIHQLIEKALAMALEYNDKTMLTIYSLANLQDLIPFELPGVLPLDVRMAQAMERWNGLDDDTQDSAWMELGVQTVDVLEKSAQALAKKTGLDPVDVALIILGTVFQRWGIPIRLGVVRTRILPSDNNGKLQSQTEGVG